jgi:hypothetical protein
MIVTVVPEDFLTVAVTPFVMTIPAPMLPDDETVSPLTRRK